MATADQRGALGQELLGGSLGLLSGAVLGVGTGALVAALPSCQRSCEADSVLGIAVGALGIVALSPLGITIAGERSGGRGSYGYALLGSLAGLSLGLAPLSVIRTDKEWVVVAHMVLAAFSTVALGTLAYRWSAEDRQEAAPSAPPAESLFFISGRL